MVGGIIFQMASVTVFGILFVVFVLRVRKRVLSIRTKTLLTATAFAIILIYIRSIYRTIELLQGWNGYLITHEVYFIVLDGAMMAACGGVFNFVHPGWFLDKCGDASKETVLVEALDSSASSIQKGREL